MKGVDISANHKENEVENRRKVWSWRVWLSMAGIVLLTGCGEVGGAGQCFGAGSSGTCVTLQSLAPTDLVTGFGPTQDVDIFQDTCDPGPPVEFESFGEHSIIITMAADLMPGVEAPPAPAYVEWTSYEITFLSNAGSNFGGIAGPALRGSVFPFTMYLPTDGTTVTQTVVLVTSVVKSEYSAAGGSTYPSMQYSVNFLFRGKTQFNDNIELGGQTTLSFGNFLHC